MKFIVLFTFLVGCASRPGIVLNESWETSPRGYQDETQAWTRQDKVFHYPLEVLNVRATYKSPVWRNAYVNWTAKLRGFDEENRQKLLAAEKADAVKFREFHFLVTTHERRENDLSKGKRSIWTLTLQDKTGKQFNPVSVERDRRPYDVIKAEFPETIDYDRAYIVRFPPEAQLDGEFLVHMGSARGLATLKWK